MQFFARAFWLSVTALCLSGCAAWTELEVHVALAEEREEQSKKALEAQLDKWVGDPITRGLEVALMAVIPEEWLGEDPSEYPSPWDESPRYKKVGIDPSTGKIVARTMLSDAQLDIQENQGCLACHEK